MSLEDATLYMETKPGLLGPFKKMFLFRHAKGSGKKTFKTLEEAKQALDRENVKAGGITLIYTRSGYRYQLRMGFVLKDFKNTKRCDESIEQIENAIKNPCLSAQPDVNRGGIDWFVSQGVASWVKSNSNVGMYI